MTASATPSIATVCIHCGGKQADAQTGRCLNCGKVAVSPGIAAEFSHPVLGQSRPSPSGAYRNGHDKPAAAPEPQIGEAAPATVDSVALAPPLTQAESAPTLAARRMEVGFVLPESRETTSWLALTRALREQLLARADKAEQQASELRAEAERCRETAAAFGSLLEQLSWRAARR